MFRKLFGCFYQKLKKREKQNKDFKKSVSVDQITSAQSFPGKQCFKHKADDVSDDEDKTKSLQNAQQADVKRRKDVEWPDDILLHSNVSQKTNVSSDKSVDLMREKIANTDIFNNSTVLTAFKSTI